MKLLVSIHDVTPALERDVRALWDLCAERDIVPALFVVPNWHGQWPLDEFPGFAAWLRAKARAGAEIFLHGERHDEVGLPRRITDRVRALGATAREGDFLTLDEAAAAARIRRGLECLRRAGLSPLGFVPPAWLAREDTFRAVRSAGLAVSEDVGGIRLHARATRLPSPVIRWSGRTPWRAIVSAAVAEARWVTARGSWLARLALHPADMRQPAAAMSVASHLDRWRRLRRQHRYALL
jgi:uncharacterized protein